MIALPASSDPGFRVRARRVRRPVSRLALLTLALALCGCGSGALPHIPVQSPVGTALSWFHSIDQHNMSLAKAHFAPPDRKLMAWGSDFDASTFSDVQCHATQQETTTSQVHCTFNIPSRPPDMRGVTFWDVYMERQPPGPWLITSYGQG